MRSFHRHALGIGALWTTVAVLGWNLWRQDRSLLSTAGGAEREDTAAEVLALRRAVPYTAVLRETIVSPQGVEVTGLEATEAVRSDGSYMRRIEKLRGSNGAGTTQSSTRMILLSEGFRILTNDIREVKSSTRYPVRMVASGIRDPKSGCLNNLLGEPYAKDVAKIGEDPIGGYRTVKVGFAGLVAWFAPAVGCAQLRLQHEPVGDSRNEQHLLSLRAGEPDPVLFAVPDHYAELRPSAFYRMDPNSAVARRLDDRYAAEHPR